MKKDYTKICLDKSIIINFDNYESLKNQCLSLDLVLDQTSFNDDQLKLKFENCFHIWTSQHQLEVSY